MADEGGKGLALVILGIIAVIAVVGMVLLFSKAHVTGKFAYAGGFAQYSPREICEERIGCPLKSIGGGTTYATNEAPYAICACPDGDVHAPLVQNFDWRTQYYPQG